ncbi:MAG: YdcF family protein [Bacteroidetes bacterium]|nr:YdcF family protein [Bacteroidota bacterium]
MKEVLIVLGSPNAPSGKLSDISKSRLDYCKKVYNNGKLILCTGGWGPHFNISKNAHASYAKDYLLKKGISKNDFLELALSSNTVDDAVKIKPILSNLNKIKLIMITSDYHLERAKLIFNEILSEYEMKFIGVKSNLNKEKYNQLKQHEQKAIASILEKGLYY